MPGLPAGAPTGDVGVDPEFWPARSGSASLALWLGPSAGPAVTAAGLTRGSCQLRQLGVAGLRRPYPRSRGLGLAPSLRSARARQPPGLIRLSDWPFLCSVPPGRWTRVVPPGRLATLTAELADTAELRHM